MYAGFAIDTIIYFVLLSFQGTPICIMSPTTHFAVKMDSETTTWIKLQL